ncbi:Pvc16 family protein [Sphingosinicella terrae]|uniref:Pvc16 family protein n=1 Tax=Sphingosinicella terrae TaxID=2172047 RepID=UPI000E0CD9CA|nr:Pvc16 family protein [Sphingosinicella terrae]
MPHPNLYGVTASLCELLRVNVWRLSGQEITISALPPEDAEKEPGSRLNLHLYHAAEDPTRRNVLPRDDIGPNPISRMPMPLTLYYVLTAHSLVNNAVDPPGQQLLMGLGMKSMHDYPLIDDALELPGPPAGNAILILDPAMRGNQNRIQVMGRQLTPEDSVSFWSAAQNHTARLTAFYEVRSLLMPPEEAVGRPGIVTAFALGVTPAGRPTLHASQSQQTVTLPALSGGATLTSAISPAVAALGATTPPAGNRVTLTGESLGDGTQQKIVLASAEFAGLTPPLTQAIIDPAYNADWGFLFRGDSVRFDVQPAVQAEDPGGSRAVPIRPGLYAVAIRHDRQLKTEAGLIRLTSAESNRIPFAVSAAIASLSQIGGRLRIQLRPGVDCTDALNLPQLSIAGDVYRFVPAFANDPAVDPGTFIAQSPTRYEADLLFDPADGATRMIRLAVNGVDSAPVWLEP